MLDPDGYDRVAERFDEYSERCVWPITECLMEMTHVDPGDCVLDVACGSGLVARRAAAYVSETGWVTGIDISPGQVATATRKSRSLGQHWSAFEVMDARELAFPDDTFDVVVAQFPHLPDRRRCIGEMFRVLKPGGRFAICNGGSGAPTWTLAVAPPATEITSENDITSLFRATLAEHFPELVTKSAGNAPKGHSSNSLKEELSLAGFADVELWSYRYTAPFHSADEALEWESLRVSTYRMHRDGLEPTRVNAFESDYRQQTQAVMNRFGSLGLATGALFGVGRKPDLKRGSYGKY